MKSYNLSKVDLKKRCEERKDDIEKRLKEFKAFLAKADDKRVFAELAFCLCTPQSKAVACWNSIKQLLENDLLFKGNVDHIESYLKGVRFKHKKAEYIVQARKLFTKKNTLSIKNFILSFGSPEELRSWLANNVKGMGLKEASHFIRNIGLSNNSLAILDRHILKTLKEFGVIRAVPKQLSKKTYEVIEKSMKDFSKSLGISLDALDLLLWSEKTGFVFR